MDNGIDKNIKEYFDQQLPDPSVQQFDKIKAEAEKRGAKSKSKFNIFKWAMSAACILVVVVLSIVLPIVLRSPDAPPERYYSADDVDNVVLTTGEAQTIIQNKYSKYNFVFEECNVDLVRGYYTKSSHKIVGISIIATGKIDPFTQIQLDLIMDKNFRLNSDRLYIENCQPTTTPQYTLYKNVVNVSGKSKYYSLFIFKDYKLYLAMDEDDTGLFEKFC